MLAAAAFALTMGARQTMGLFLSSLNSATHLPGVIAACGLPVQFGAWSLAVGWAVGWTVGRWRMKSLLSLVYAALAVAVLTFLSTVPPTAGLVAKFFGVGSMVTLFGLVMLTQQAGGFLGAWLGGKVFEATGNYDVVWTIDITLAVAAALVHLPIREACLVRAAA